MLLRMFLGLWVLNASGLIAFAFDLSFHFEGDVTNNFGGLAAPFGFNIPTGTSVNGHFSYDTESPATHFPTGGVAYLQQRPRGFVMNFGDLEVIADEYVIEVFNDLPARSGGDLINVRFSSDLVPSIMAPLAVDGVERDVNGNPVGVLTLSLGGPSFLDDALLPASLDSQAFDDMTGFFSDDPDGIPIVVTVDSLVSVPEPGSALISLAGLVSLAIGFYPLMRADSHAFLN